MCIVKQCAICKVTTEMCGKVCHGSQCQLYLPLYYRKHFRDGKTHEFDKEVWEMANPLWSRVIF